MDDLLVGLTSNLLWAVIGGLSLLVFRFVFRTLPTRRLWRLSDPNEVLICSATSTTTDTGTYHRPATGIGQLRGTVLATTSLNKAYRRKLKISNVLLSKEPIQNRLENDLILLGGPKNNRFTRLLLDKLKERSVVDQEGSDITCLVDELSETFSPVDVNQEVKKDIGLIVRMSNPFSTGDSTVCLFSGGHTYGTIAATRYFTEDLYHQAQRFKHLGRNMVIIVSCDVVGGYPVNVRSELEHKF